MGKKKVLVSHCEIPQPALDLLKEKYECIICPELPAPTRQQVLDRLPGVDAVFWWGKGSLDKEFLDKAGSSLKVLALMSAGYNHVDVTEVKARGIKLGNTPNVLDAAVADQAVLLALAAGRRMQEGRQRILDNQWDIARPQWLLGQQLKDSVVGIVGLGGIGQAISKRLRAFEISKLLYTGHKPKPEATTYSAEFVSLDTLLRESDYVLIACPLNSETRSMFNEGAFSKMKPNSILVNISRGEFLMYDLNSFRDENEEEVVDQSALVKALETGQIFAAGLDVMYPEPLPPDHKLLSLNNCVIVPHLGSATLKTRTDMAMLTARNIIAGLEGTPLPAPL
uniref:Glyoxylate reductase/hydroxypyruvate reductase n=1 Tax=Timema cristinae TaxID=61476 RepID=A0A7R9CT12_TIMCR|nr:unnamed protein product [Timema cristinae]